MEELKLKKNRKELFDEFENLQSSIHETYRGAQIQLIVQLQGRKKTINKEVKISTYTLTKKSIDFYLIHKEENIKLSYSVKKHGEVISTDIRTNISLGIKRSLQQVYT